jgi:hypothetical protein
MQQPTLRGRLEARLGAFQGNGYHLALPRWTSLFGIVHRQTRMSTSLPESPYQVETAAVSEKRGFAAGGPRHLETFRQQSLREASACVRSCSCRIIGR